MALSCYALFVTLVLAILCEESEEKCIVVSKTDSYCDTLQDLYANDRNLQKSVMIYPSMKTDLEQFQQVSVESARNIERLTIQRAINGISEDAFKNFPDLKFLTFYSNELHNIPSGVFQDLNVTYLSFNECGVKTLAPGAFVNLPQMERLRIENNTLTTITKNVFNNLTVHTLSLSRNQISSVETRAFGNMSQLKRLYLDHNELSEFNVQEYLSSGTTLERLWLHRNNLTQITAYMLEGLSNLKVLNVGFNSISSVEPKALAETPKLTTLVLTHNLLAVMDGGVLPAAGLPDLKVLYLDHNRLTYLSSNFLFRLNALRSMSIGGNPWQCACLDLVLRWLGDNNVELKCDQEYFSGKRPVCLVPSTRSSNNVCVYSYNEKHYELFDSHNKLYPPVSFCIL
jgi:insulin-like growth factor-binding protein complex acid labile subunit